ncbi:hypothetical protein EVG20_g9868 [Dentipellis fragilis]|uniref:Eukaryotic translation initiation factor 4E n=1 Tax=Dentipellis fragilis TaxID=205917 RepID=A0A4Y9XVD8_9AGAM|nr:hypothetical protein EVG20_g9868 [Dentipellis fragilis]
MASASSLPGSALQASRSAVQAALAEHPDATAPAATAGDKAKDANGDSPEPGEIQEIEVDMQAQAESIKTVFSDPKNFNVKHPLYSPWTLWFDSPATKGRNLPQTPSSAFPQTPLPQTPGGAAALGWMEDIKRVISFDSVEEFWGLYNNIVPPSQLPQKANYYLFKDGIIPAWEDDANKNGGKWSIQLPKDKNRNNIDKMWLYTMLAAIGETFDPYLTNPETPPGTASLVTGVIVSTRPQFYRLSIWTRQAPSATPGEDESLRERIEAVGRHFKTSVLGYSDSQKLAGPLATEVEFLSHKDSEKKGKSARKITVLPIFHRRQGAERPEPEPAGFPSPRVHDGRPTSPGSGEGSAGKSHTLEQLQYQLRAFQQSYSTTGPIQKLITVEKGVALDFDSVNRDSQTQSKELYTWGQGEATDIKDVSDRLAFLNFISGSLASSLAQKLNAARSPLKALRDNDNALAARRTARANLQSQIVRLEHSQERGYEKRIAELKDQLRKAERDDEPSEKEHEILKRKALRESEQLKFEAFREYGEKVALISQASEAILNVLPSIPPSSPQAYTATEQTGSIRATLQHALDNWKPGQTTLTAPAGVILDRSHTKSFGETHANELAKISIPETQSKIPLTPPPGPAQGTAPARPAVPIPGSGAAASPEAAVRTLEKAPSPAPASAPSSSSPTINTAVLNNAPSPIPVASGSPPLGVSPDPAKPDTTVPSVTPTVAETGVPVSAGADGPGPSSGSLHDIKAPHAPAAMEAYGSTKPTPDSVPTPIPEETTGTSPGHFESAEDEKKRLEREERERLLQGATSSPGAATSGTPTHESAEDEKKRLEREERERLLQSGASGAGAGVPPPTHPEDGDTPPPYQDF